jgi:hypothetical protein
MFFFPRELFLPKPKKKIIPHLLLHQLLKWGLDDRGHRKTGGTRVRGEEGDGRSREEGLGVDDALELEGEEELPEEGGPVEVEQFVVEEVFLKKGKGRRRT